MSFNANSIWASNEKEPFSLDADKSLKISTDYHNFEMLAATKAIYMRLEKYPRQVSHIPVASLWVEKVMRHGRIISHGHYIVVDNSSHRLKIEHDAVYGSGSGNKTSLECEGVRIK